MRTTPTWPGRFVLLSCNECVDIKKKLTATSQIQKGISRILRGFTFRPSDTRHTNDGQILRTLLSININRELRRSKWELEKSQEPHPSSPLLLGQRDRCSKIIIVASNAVNLTNVVRTKQRQPPTEKERGFTCQLKSG
jgi:hypothetical protein